jgi:hypothetical protein
MIQRLRIFVFLIAFGGSISAQITEELSVPTQMYIPEDTFFVHLPETDDTLELPYIDDFSERSSIPNPGRWADRFVYINNTYGINPPTMGVATFDGLNQYGRPYDITAGQVSVECDRLTSRHINLQGKSNVYFSFLYQEAGRGENPSNADSLRLQFWSPADSTWRSVWRVIGNTGPFNRFEPVIIHIDDPMWLQKGFRFRFTSFGNPGGAFDVWNIDYIFLNENRLPDDTLPRDVAFIDQHPSIIGTNFESIPWWVYGSNPGNFTRSFVTQSYKRNVPPGSIGNILLSGYSLQGQGLNINVNGNVNDAAGHGQLHYQRIEWDQAIQPFHNNLDPITGAFTLEMRSHFSGTAVGLRRNDTLVRNQFFGNYYAYDDGSAERAYGIANQAGAISLSSFSIQANDTLLGLYIYFQPADADPRNNAFQIIVYENNNGIPGNKIYESDSLFVPRFSEHNQFIPFPLDDGVFLPTGSYYIGTKQRDAAKLNIGFDVNNTNKNTLIYGDGSNWYPTIFEGTLMLRPYFRYQAPEISVKKQTQMPPWKVYPNPTNDRIRIETPLSGDFEYAIRDMQGRMVEQGKARNGEEISLGHLNAGTYLLMDASNGSFRGRLIIQPR